MCLDGEGSASDFGLLGGGFDGSDARTSGCRGVGDPCCRHFLPNGLDLQSEREGRGALAFCFQDLYQKREEG